MNKIEALGTAVIYHFKNIDTSQGAIDLYEYLVKYETIPSDCILKDSFSNYSFKKLIKSIDQKHDDLMSYSV